MVNCLQQTINERVKELNLQWPRESITNQAMVSSVTRAKYYCQKIKDSWQTLHKDKSNRILSHNEEQLHQLEKIKIQTNCKKLSDLLCNTCFNNLSVITDKLDEWLSSSQVIIVRFDCLFKALVIFMNDCNSLSAAINSLKETEVKHWNKLFQDAKIIKSRSSSTCTSGLNSGDNFVGACGGQPSGNGHVDEKNNDSYSEMFFSCENLPVASLPAHISKELIKLQDAHHKIWSSIKENEQLISYFESMSTSDQSQ